MTKEVATAPLGAHPADGVVHRPSPHSVSNTVERLIEALTEAGAKLFDVVDHSGEAEEAGLVLRETKLLVFGSPALGTPVMDASPVAALDLPLKVLVWSDDAGAVWMTYLSARWLAERHGIAPDLAKTLAAVEGLTTRIATSG